MEQKIHEGSVLNKHDEKGHEIVDSTPLAIPIHWQRPLTIQDMVRRFVQTEVSRVAEAEGHETFEEADDFDTGEDEDIRSPYQLDDEQEHADRSSFLDEKPKEKPDPQPPAAKPEPPAKPPKKPRKAPPVAPEDDPEGGPDE